MIKLTDRQLYFPKLSVGVRNYLLGLVVDVESIRERINSCVRYEWYWNEHSINPHSEALTEVERSILFLEDRRFFRHNGFELRSIPRAIKRMAKGRGLGGMSTIEQQIVRIITRRRERTFSRKFRESILAILINFHSAKREIFHFYLHNSYFGYRLIGCEVASRFIFRMRAADLDSQQGAFLASLLPLPLPKAVFNEIQNGNIGADARPEEIILAGYLVAPRWAERVEGRYKFAAKNYLFTPSNL